MAIRHLAQPFWHDELDSFSRQHEGWLVSLRAATPRGEVTFDAHDVPLLGVVSSSTQPTEIEVALGNRRDHLSHIVSNATAVHLELTADGADRGLIIDSADGTRTTLQFKSAARPEEVDGLAEHTHR
jgi:hypothetical protein